MPDQFRIGATISTRSYLSAQHLWTARHNAELCRQREVAIAGKRPIDVQHRSYATTAVLMSVTFLEATVNEVFEDAADDWHVGRGNTASSTCEQKGRKQMTASSATVEGR